MVKLPSLLVNFKAYPQATGKNALALAKALEKASKETGVSVVACVQPTDLKEISSNVSIPVFSQHFDPLTPGSRTGHLVLESLKDSGAVGSLLNHAEFKIDNQTIIDSLKRANELNIPVLLCVESIERLKQVTEFEIKPWAVAIEPPELIGGDISVSTAKPELITDTVKIVDENLNVPVITGAGIKNKDDVEIALKLGTKGVLVASGIVKAEDQYTEILNLLKGF